MRNRTRVIAAAAVATAALAGSSAAVASTPGTTTAAQAPAARAKTVSTGAKCFPGSPVAARLGVSSDRLDQALRSFKMSVRTTTGDVSLNQFYTAVARNLGVSQTRVRQAFMAGNPGCTKAGGPKPGGIKQAQAAMAAVVARELHVSTARVAAALRSVFAAGHADTGSPAFAAAARSLGVSTQQLATALMHAKESLATGPSSGT